MRFYPALLFAAVILAAAGCHSKDSDSNAKSSEGGNKLTKLSWVDTKVGTGDPVAKDDDVWVMYKGTLANGSVFDTNEKPGGEPFHVTVGEHQVIQGWDQGLVGMREGGIRKLSIPSDLAYGKAGKDPIPPDTDLYFEVEVKRLLTKKDAQTVKISNIKIGTGQEAKNGDTVQIDYKLYAGEKLFEDSKSNVTKPAIFKIGADRMTIPGFDTCIIGMKVGGTREVIIPPVYARLLHNEKIGANFVRADITLTSVK